MKFCQGPSSDLESGQEENTSERRKYKKKKGHDSQVFGQPQPLPCVHVFKRERKRERDQETGRWGHLHSPK